MPKEIKAVILLLLFSAAFPFIGTYIDSLEYPEQVDLSLSYSTDVFWLCIVVWIVQGIIVRREYHKLTLLIFGLISIAFLIWDYFDYGFNLSQSMYLLETLFFFIGWYILGKKACRDWCDV